jgi:hypothetical protein
MNNGVLIFAHNSREVDYATLAMVSASLAKKSLNVPVSLATDLHTIEWLKESDSYDKAVSIFDQIIIIEKPETSNKRALHDGSDCSSVPFVNTDRCIAYDITPYDRTLLIDSDFLILTDRLNHYWTVDESVMISQNVSDIFHKDRFGYLDKYISDTGIPLFWATTVMFTKNNTGKLFFDLVNSIKNNYEKYSRLYRFDHRQFRNDIAFSIASHIMSGFETRTEMALPELLTALDRDVLFDVSADKKLQFLVSIGLTTNYCAASLSGIDIHVMNKQSIIRNANKLLEI